jgi:hypothetical protein
MPDGDRGAMAADDGAEQDDLTDTEWLNHRSLAL